MHFLQSSHQVRVSDRGVGTSSGVFVTQRRRETKAATLATDSTIPIGGEHSVCWFVDHCNHRDRKCARDDSLHGLDISGTLQMLARSHYRPARRIICLVNCKDSTRPSLERQERRHEMLQASAKQFCTCCGVGLVTMSRSLLMMLEPSLASHKATSGASCCGSLARGPTLSRDWKAWNPSIATMLGSGRGQALKGLRKDWILHSLADCKRVVLHLGGRRHQAWERVLACQHPPWQPQAV